MNPSSVSSSVNEMGVLRPCGDTKCRKPTESNPTDNSVEPFRAQSPKHGQAYFGPQCGPSLGSRSVTISEWKGYVRACRENRGLQFGRPSLGSRSSTRSFLTARRRPSSRRSVTGSSRIRIGGRTPSRPTNRGASNITKGSAKPLAAGERLLRLMRPRSIIC